MIDALLPLPAPTGQLDDGEPVPATGDGPPFGSALAAALTTAGGLAPPRSPEPLDRDAATAAAAVGLAAFPLAELTAVALARVVRPAVPDAAQAPSTGETGAGLPLAAATADDRLTAPHPADTVAHGHDVAVPSRARLLGSPLVPETQNGDAGDPEAAPDGDGAPPTSIEPLGSTPDHPPVDLASRNAPAPSRAEDQLSTPSTGRGSKTGPAVPAGSVRGGAGEPSAVTGSAAGTPADPFAAGPAPQGAPRRALAGPGPVTADRGTGSARLAGPSPDAATAPAPVPVGEPSATADVLPAAVSRVLEAVEALEHAPPPRTLTLDLTELDGTRLRVIVRGQEVQVTLLGDLRGTGREPGFTRELEAALAGRGFTLAGAPDRGGGGTRDPSSPAPRWARPEEPTERSPDHPRRRADHGLRL